MTGALGPYRLEGELARGAMGIVYRAYDPELRREVALKLLARGPTPAALARFQREAAALARLRHAHLVGVHAVGEHEGRPYLVMDLVEGETLQGRLEREGPPPPWQAALWIRQLALALDHAHSLSILHRDVTPMNAMVGSQGQAVLTDFGLALDGSRSGERLTVTGRFLGTPGYCPPEQAEGELEALGPRSDVYGLGATLYALLTGVPPIEGASLVEVLIATRERRPRPPSRLRAGIPPGLEAACLRCLEKDPARRFASAAELARALLPHTTPGAPPPRRPWLAALALGLGGLGGGALVLSLRDPPAPLPESSPAPVAAPATDQARELYQRGLARKKRGDLPGAIEDYGRAIEVWPAWAEAWTNRGNAKSDLGDLSGALADHSRAIELDPELARAWYNRGLVKREQGDQAGARADFTRAIELDPSDASSWNSRGNARKDLGDQAGAVEDYTRALELDPGNARAWSNRAIILSDLKQHEASLRDHDRALELEPNLAAFWSNRANARKAAGDRAGALSDFDRAVALDPGLAPAWLGRANTRWDAEDFAGAASDLSRAIELTPGNAELWGMRGQLRMKLGDPAGAEEDATRAIELQPGLFPAWIDRGDARLARGDRPGAEADWRHAGTLCKAGSREAGLVQRRLAKLER